nr:MAG TPA: RNA dependent RNA polymerase [Caudoviricetes sp.]
MDNIFEDVNLNYSTYGDGKAIIEILNIGFEPLLTPDEYKLYKEIGDWKYKKNGTERSLSFINSKLLYYDDESYCNWLGRHKAKLEVFLELCKEKEKELDDQFREMLKNNTNIQRQIYPDREFKSEEQFRNISIFESDLNRCFGCKDMEHSYDIISVVTYYTEIFESIMMNGFDYLGKHFVFFTAGAGQTRCKKSTFVNEELLNKNYKRLFCGLTREDINKLGGMNTNKYLAYTSLCQTNSEIWKGFNIDRAIVVPDIEYDIPDQEVRYIYTESPEDKVLLEQLQNEVKEHTNKLKQIKEAKKNRPKGTRRSSEEIMEEKRCRAEKNKLIEDIKSLKSKYHRSEVKRMPVTIPFTDGFGISLKKMESSMIRLPFVKGLIAYCPRRAFIDWCSEHNISIKKITDIYGKSYSINEIDYIFTESQFKMHKYYQNILDENGNVIKTGWEVYQENFKKYECDACRCNVERGVKLNSKTNYQILQTLTTEMTDEDILKLAAYDINNLNGIGRNVQCMLNVLDANEKRNDNMNWLQKSLVLYPEMLKDFYVKTLLKNTKDSMIKKFRSGKFNINGAYTFAIPDTLACLQWWFTDMDKTDIENFGFVQEGHVSCNLFDNKEELDCLRSPHLDHAHCIRKNQVNDSTKKWVKSAGVYIGMKDTMSKLLMYDNDGDKLLVHNNKTIIKCAKQYQSKHGMIPNYYDMPKANPELLNNKSLFDGIVMAYHHGNIGTPSNEITKVWTTLHPGSSEEEIQHAIDVIALRCTDVNFTIDYAKTLYKPTIPNEILERYKVYSGRKVPHFFMYAKGKRKDQVEELGQCNIDRISNVVKSNRIVFKNLLGKYSYKILMKEPTVDIKTEKAQEIISLYRDIEATNLRKISHIEWDSLDFREKKKVQLQIQFDSNKQRELFRELIGESKEYITDILVKALQDDVNKDTLWRLFGNVIYSNIERNLKGTKICCKCGKRFSIENQNDYSSKYCNDCKLEIMREKDRKKKQKKRNFA